MTPGDERGERMRSRNRRVWEVKRELAMLAENARNHHQQVILDALAFVMQLTFYDLSSVYMVHHPELELAEADDALNQLSETALDEFLACVFENTGIEWTPDSQMPEGSRLKLFTA